MVARLIALACEKIREAVTIMNSVIKELSSGGFSYYSC